MTSTLLAPDPPSDQAEATPAPPSGVDLLVVVVNYRSAELAIDCLASLEPEVQGYPGAHVAVVENASGADQVDRLRGEIDRRGWNGWVTLIEAGRNGGFAAGNNVAIRWALGWHDKPELFWLLNPDTVVRPGALAGLVAFLRDRPDVGLAGSRLEHLDATPQFSAFRFPSLLGELDGGLRLAPVSRLLRDKGSVRPIADRPEPVDWVAGASVMIRRSVVDRVGSLDERFFMYYEEVDFCRRARDAGWSCWYVPESRVVHLVGQSSGVTSTASPANRRPRYWFEARRRYFRTHHGAPATFLINLVHVAALATYRLRRAIQRKPDADPKLYLWDMVRYNFLRVGR